MSKEERGDILAITTQTKAKKPISEHDRNGFIKMAPLILACNNLE